MREHLTAILDSSVEGILNREKGRDEEREGGYMGERGRRGRLTDDGCSALCISW